MSRNAFHFSAQGVLTLACLAAACSNPTNRSFSSAESAIGGAEPPAWTARLGGTGNEQISGAAIDSAGNVIVAGQTSTTFDSQTALGLGEGFVTKYSSGGTKQWTRVVGTTAADVAFGVAIGTSDSLYTTGYVRASIDGQTFGGGTDLFVSKLDSSGTRLWSRQQGAAGNDVGYGVAVRGGAVVVAGLTATTLPGSTAAGGTDIAIVRYDESGTLSWAKSFGSNQADQAAGAAIDASGNVYVAGTAGAALPGMTALGGKDIFLTKYDAAGTRLWISQVGTSADDSGTGVTIGADDGIYVSGTTAGGLSGPLAGATDAVLVKFNASGAVVWTKQLGGVAADEALGIASDSSFIYLSGRTAGQLPGANAGTTLNFFAAKYDVNGTIQTVREYAGGITTAGISVGIAAANGRLILAGGVTSAAFDGLVSWGNNDGVVLSLCSGHNFSCELAGSCGTGNGGCTASQACTPDVSGFVLCGCNTGYTGNMVCSDVNECTVNNGGCDALTTCANTVGSRTCSACPGGYTGTGATGCVDVNECTTNNGGCDPHATCVNSPGSSSCGACLAGFTGTNATGCTDVDECGTTGTCDPLTTCSNTPGSFTCSACPAGFTGTGQTGCQDLNECNTAGACDPLTTCTNTYGNWTCSACPAGYSGDGRSGCHEIDECANPSSCDVLTTCTNTTGSYTCSACPAGYTGTGKTGCVDIDECTLTSNGGCDPLTACNNIGGSYFCGACPMGYSGTGATGCISGCATHNGGCDALSTCNDATGAVICGACPSGYAGTGATGCFGPPTGVSATGGNASATVTWTAPVAHGNDPILGFIVTCNPGTKEAIAVGAATTTATVSGLTNGTAYTCTVRGASASQQSRESAASNSITPLGPPGAPTGVTAVASSGQVTVSWTAPTNNGGASISGYTVVASPGTATATTTGATTATVTGLTNGTPYTFTVYATNSYGNGQSSTGVAATPATTPGAPTGVTGAPGNQSATVSWTAAPANGSPITQSVVFVATGGGTPITIVGAATTGVVTGLTNGSSYTFTVRSSNAVGLGTTSAASAAVVPRTVPGLPTGVVAIAANASATVSWLAPASTGGSAITSYTVTGTYASGSVTKSTSGTSAVVTGLVNGTSYSFVVKACNAAGCGANTAAAPAVVPFTTASAPQNIVATAGDGQASLTWSAPATTGGFAITNYTVSGGPTALTIPTTSTVVTGLTNGRVYNFSVVANTSVGAGTPGWANAVTPASATCESATICATGNGGCAGYQACTYDGCHHSCGCPAGLVDNGASCTTLGPAWTARPATSGADQVNATAIDSAGNVVVAGFTTGNLDSQTNTGVQDAFVTKYSPTGTRLWTRLLGSTLGDGASGVAIGTADSIYVAGYARGSVDAQAAFGGPDVMLAKYDASGNKQWTRLLGTSTTDAATAVAVRGGAVYVAGYTLLNMAGSTRGGANDALIAKYDESGTLQWAKSFGTLQDDFANGIAVDSAGNAYLTGTTSGSMPGFTSSGGKDVFLAKYSASGAQLALIQGGTDLDDNGAALAVGPDNGVYFAGAFRSSSTGLDAAVMKFDTDCNIVWQTILSSDALDEGLAIATDESSVYMTGRSLGQLPGANSYGDLNIFVAKFAPGDGTQQQVREYSGAANTAGITFGMGVAAAGGRVVLGGYASSTFDNVNVVGGVDGVVLDVCNGPNFACEIAGSCTVSNGGCTASQTCTGASGSKVFCSCGNGYTGSVFCADVNECRAANGGCDALTTCTNTLGARVCGTCPGGYTGTGATGCTDVNECLIGNGGCDRLTVCNNTPGGSSCGACPSGYNGTGATGCTDVDECVTNNGGCDYLTNCTNTPGSRVCGTCPVGYTGTGATSCLDINECAINNGGCGPLTNCINAPGAFSCGTGVSASPSTVTIGGATSTTTIHLRMLGPTGAPQAGETISLSVSGSQNHLVPSTGVTDANGYFVARLTSGVAETKTITASAGEQTLTTTVTFQNPALCDVMPFAMSQVSTGATASGVDLALSPFNATVAVTAADFNGDGAMDFAFADPNAASPGIKILLGNGDGTFVAGSTYGVGFDLLTLAQADFNEDGRVDLLVVNRATSSALILPGAGDGTFQSPVTQILPEYVIGVVVADFDNDGHDDILVDTTSALWILVGDGTGAFPGSGMLVSFSDGQTDLFSRLVATDLNGDGTLDLLATRTYRPSPLSTATSDLTQLFRNNGDGSFSQATSFTSDFAYESLAVGDFTSDGVLDIGRYDSSAFVGSGLEPTPTGIRSTSGSDSAVAVDLNGDGESEMLASTWDVNTLGTGKTIQSYNSAGLPVQTSVGTTSPDAVHGEGLSVAVGDFNGDGKLDVLYGGGRKLLLNTCQ